MELLKIVEQELKKEDLEEEQNTRTGSGYPKQGNYLSFQELQTRLDECLEVKINKNLFLFKFIKNKLFKQENKRLKEQLKELNKNSSTTTTHPASIK